MTERVRIEREVVRDTMVTIEPDSAMIEALIECDSNNQVLIKRMSTVEGLRLRYEVRSEETRSKTAGHMGKGHGGLKLVVKCREDSIREAVQVKDRVITDSISVKEIEYVEVEKPMTAWNRFLTVCGWILLTGVVSVVIISVIIIVWKLVKR